MVGYMNNILSDRSLIRFCSDSLSVRLYLGYDLDEQLPCHSTISRTRKLLGSEVFLSMFQQVLCLCVEKGMVSGRRQAVDSAFIKANASMDSMRKKQVLADGEFYVKEVEQTNDESGEKNTARVSLVQATEDLDENGNLILGKHISNKNHYSPTDPDAKISTKPGKARSLNYYGQIAVDTRKHVITGATADFADKRDSQCLEKLVEKMIENLSKHQLTVKEVLADANYSSGKTLKYLEEKNLNAWMPNFGPFQIQREGFIFNKEKNCYQCQRGNQAHLLYKDIVIQNGYRKILYRSSETVCLSCSLKGECCGKNNKHKSIYHSQFYQYYERQHRKLTTNTGYAKRMSRLRSSTVEPVLGTLLNFTGMKKVYARGIEQAEKHVIMASLCYNLKKMIKVRVKKSETKANSVPIKEVFSGFGAFLFPFYLTAFFSNNANWYNRKINKILFFLNQLFPKSGIDLHLSMGCATDTCTLH
jgi:IS5 family transposase